jgi:uncharacterized protein YhaN
VKLLRLDLLAFGSLSAATIDLASDGPCLHLVYGANEAGKSTALRALHGLFYGIPESTLDTHRFRGNELRIAALLQDARGRELYVVRRKGRKQTLAAADGTPLAGADASWITAGMPEAQFRSMFALSYDTLEQGADELLGSAGELGQSLFSAGTGGAGAHAVLESLRQEADALYRPRGRTQRLNAALAVYEAAKRSVREQSVRAESFAEQQRAIESAEEDAGRLQSQRQQLMAERVRLERARRVLPLLAKRAELRRQRAELGVVVSLPESATEERRLLERSRRDASLRIEHVDAEIAKLEEARAALQVNDAWLEPANQLQLTELRDRLVQYRRAQRALPVRRDALARAQTELLAMLERLGLRVAFGDIESLRVSRPLEAKIREHARRGETVISRCAELARQVAAKRDEAARQRESLVARRFDPDSTVRQIELPLSPERVSLTLDQVTEFERAAAELDREQRACADKLRAEEDALERTERDLEALATAGQPPTEAQLAAAREARQAWSAKLRAALENPEVVEHVEVSAPAPLRSRDEASAPAPASLRTRDVAPALAAELQRSRDVTEARAPAPLRTRDEASALAAELQRTRDEASARAPASQRSRDAASAPALQRSCDVADAPAAELQRSSEDASAAELQRSCEDASASELQRSRDVASASEPELLRSRDAATETADVIADRLRREATRVAEHVRLHAESELPHSHDVVTGTTGEAADRPRHEATGVADNARLRAASELLHSLDVATETADVIADRLRREATRVAEYARLRAAHGGAQRQLERHRTAAAALAERAREAERRWQDLCERAGVAPRAPALMRAFLAEHRAEALRLEQLDREASRLERELESEQRERDAWLAHWNELVAKVGSPAGASVAEVEALLTGLHDVFARLDATKTDAREIEVLAHESSEFESELASLRERLLPELELTSWDAVAERLHARDHAERDAAKRVAQLEAQQAARGSERERALHEHATTERELAVLMQAAGVADLAALEAAEEAARRARVLDDAIAQVQAELLAAADGFEPAVLEDELRSTPVPEVQARLQEVEDALERVELERETAVHTLESRRAGLAVLRESRGATDAALDAGAELENVRLLAQRYVRVRLAYGVLAREVERYRERHTGPILRGASALFSQLTQGAWRGLEADFGESDEPVLSCVRANGERVGVQGLSAGTRDQLYLALRLASIEQLSAARELMPLVMDDLLVHFDDDRAGAALRALGEFANVTQVLLFTHHARLCELANEVLPESQLKVHKLSAAPARELTLLRTE